MIDPLKTVDRSKPVSRIRIDDPLKAVITNRLITGREDEVQRELTQVATERAELEKKKEKLELDARRK